MRARVAVAFGMLVSVGVVGSACSSGNGTNGEAQGDDGGGGNDALASGDGAASSGSGSGSSSGSGSGGQGDAPSGDAPSDAAMGGDASGCLADDGGAFPPLPAATLSVSSTCPSASTCGGALDGTYTLGSWCVTQSALFQEVTNFCSAASFVNVSASNARGILSVAGGTLSLEMHANVSAMVDFPNACTFCQCGSMLEGQLGAAGLIASCSPVCNSGTCSCTIDATVDVADSGTYTSSSSAGTFTTSGGLTFDYCESASGVSVADPSGAFGAGSFATDTAPSPEKCDGIDNDLDGVIDDHLRDCATCLSQGVCAAHTSSCKGIAGWACSYPSTYQHTETLCDGLDNDCNGVVDDEPAADQTCASTKGVGYVCRSGACTCPGMVCGSACVDPQSNPANCGTCGNACALGATCVGGQCQCPASTPDVCGNRCVNTQTDTSYCGNCTTACPTGASCTAGSCVCPPSTPDVCNDTCVNKGSDQNNCGTCNDVCVVGCSAGACANVLQLAAGTSTSFAALSDGTARGWGIDSQGDLGNGYTNTGAATKATLVAGLSNVAGVARGGRCAWLASGAPYCWGPNDYGELGDGTTNMQLSPVPVSGLTQVAGMAAGSEFTCAWNAAGSAWCWGTLGGTVPVAISGLSNVVEMAGGLLHVCARTTAGSVYCWGDNSSGQCGGTTSTLTSPTQVAGIANAVQIATGDLHTCALTSSGNVYCWGWNQYGQIGDGSSGSNHTTPTLVTTSSGGPALGSVSQVGAGSGHTCARLSNGTVECWGWNQDGELGDGTSITRSSPGPVTAISTAANDMAVYGEHVCTRVASGAVQCWGNDTFGDAPSIVQW